MDKSEKFMGNKFNYFYKNNLLSNNCNGNLVSKENIFYDFKLYRAFSNFIKRLEKIAIIGKWEYDSFIMLNDDFYLNEKLSNILIPITIVESYSNFILKKTNTIELRCERCNGNLNVNLERYLSKQEYDDYYQCIQCDLHFDVNKLILKKEYI